MNGMVSKKAPNVILLEWFEHKHINRFRATNKIDDYLEIY